MICEKNRKPNGRAATIGTFDGVHRGHLDVIGQLERRASEEGLEPVVVTFDRHPLEVVAPERVPSLLTTAAERLHLLGATGVEVSVYSFTRELMGLTAREWLARLRRDLGVTLLLMGHDHTFGCDGKQLTLTDFQRIGAEEGVRVERATALPGVSSSRIRALLAEGNVEEAALLLGRPFSREGEVVHGRAIGRTIHFPTANILPAPGLLTPRAGVYAALARVDADLPRPALVNIGRRPTVESNGHITIETHIPGFSGDLYGRHLRIEFQRFIREEVKFDSLDSLSTQIALDLESLKNFAPLQIFY